MAFFRGENGEVKIGASDATAEEVKTVAVVTSWTANVTRETYEVTRIGRNYRQYTGGMLTVTGTIDFIFDSSDSATVSIFTALKDEPDSEIMKLFLYNGNTETIESNVIFNSIDASATVGEITSMTANFSNSGAVTFKAPA